MPGFIRNKPKRPSTKPSRDAQENPTKPSPKQPPSTSSTTTPNPTLKRPRPQSSLSIPSPLSKKPRPSPPTPPIPSQPRALPPTLPANAHAYLHDPTGLLPSLLDTHSVTTMQIISSSRMTTRIARSLDVLLRRIDFADPKAKPGVVMLYARAATAAKLVSVVEVVKREVESRGTAREGDRAGVWFQYSGLGEGVGVLPRRREKQKGGEAKEMEVDGEEEDGDAAEEGFEIMKTRRERLVEGTEKIRAVPVMTVYLSRVRIEKLKDAYGEQTNSTK